MQVKIREPRLAGCERELEMTRGCCIIVEKDCIKLVNTLIMMILQLQMKVLSMSSSRGRGMYCHCGGGYLPLMYGSNSRKISSFHIETSPGGPERVSCLCGTGLCRESIESREIARHICGGPPVILRGQPTFVGRSSSIAVCVDRDGRPTIQIKNEPQIVADGNR